MIPRFKLVLLGDTSVGKTSIIHRLIYDGFSSNANSTIGSAFLTYTTQINDKNVKIDIWDTAGQERYRAFISMYYRDIDVCLLVFDLNNINEKHIKNWIEDFYQKTNNEDAKVVLIGNKYDLVKEKIGDFGEYLKSYEVLSEIIQKYDLKFVPTSASTGYNIQELFAFVETLLREPFKKRFASLFPEEIDEDGGYGYCYC